MIPGLLAGILAGGPRVAISDQTISHSVFDAGTAQAGYVVDSDGKAYRNVGGSLGAIAGEWMLRGVNSDYEVRATKVTGVNPSGSALGSWLPCTSDNDWFVTDTGGGGTTTSCTLTIEIRDDVSLVVLDSASITLEATSNDPL